MLIIILNNSDFNFTIFAEKKIKMKKLIISLTIFLLVISCKGPGSGPLVRESFDKKDNDKDQVMSGQKSTGPAKTEKINVSISTCEGCIKISDLLSGKKSYAGKVIKVTGQVTKYNAGIMGKNWVHIQDGTEFDGGFDLTVTTDIQTSVGETVTFEGKIVLDKDFGYGYFYAVLMENGTVAL
jgi:hypothetical protein